MIERRGFLWGGSVLAVAGVVSPSDALARLSLLSSGRVPRLLPGERADLVLRGAVVFDGTGAPGREADVAVVGDRIAEVGRVARDGGEEIDLSGLALAPGLIDIHSHADLSLLVEPRAESRVRQGITLEVVGQDGSSIGPWSEEVARRRAESYRERYGVELDFHDLAGFFRALGRARPAVNLASMVGHGTVRGTVVGGEDRPATAAELREMRTLVREALDQGAVGFSTGLEYTPGSFAPVDELIALASELAGTGYPYASHMRNEDDQLLAAVEEALHVGRMAGVPVQVSHLKAQGRRNYWKADVVLHLLEEARRGRGDEPGVDVHFDRYPYVAYSTGLSNLFPTWSRAGGDVAFADRLADPGDREAILSYARDKVALLGTWDSVQITSVGADELDWVVGRKLGEAARERGLDPLDLALDLMVDGGGAGMIGYGMSEENTARILAHPLGMVCSDGGSFAPYGPLSGSSPHPRSYGTFPRLLGHYVRDEGVLTLEEAVHKVTVMPATKLRLRDRGVVRPGAYADLVAFDPTTVADGATFSRPHTYPRGIPHVVVNGVVTLRDGEQTGELAGRPVRGVSDREVP
ncbi:MAG: D-aminoacylase [Gemmatimonadota bacterium]|jgi:N-acyl-D-amino-acid deacylase